MNSAYGQTPIGCTGSGLGVSMFVNHAQAHVGDSLTYDVLVANSPFPACLATGITASLTLPNGTVVGLIGPDGVRFPGTRTSANGAVTQEPVGTGPVALAPGETLFFERVVINLIGQPYVIAREDLQVDETNGLYVAADADIAGDIQQNENRPVPSSAHQRVVNFVSEPCADITLNCVEEPPGSGNIVYTGTVSNCGNRRLVELDVTIDIGGQRTLLLDGITLLVGESRDFTMTFTPDDLCGPVTAVAEVAARDGIFSPDPRSVATTASSTCTLRVLPGIALEARCLPGASPDHVFSYEGTVTNTGNVALSDVVVISNQPTSGNVIFALDLLPAGASIDFVGGFRLPAVADRCAITSILQASGNDVCAGDPVSSPTVTTTCEIVVTPIIKVYSECPSGPTAQGASLTYSGSVVNMGNVTLNDVAVTSDRPTPGTVVFTLNSLAPGQSVDFTGSFIVPGDCCTVKNTLHAEGRDPCMNSVVTDTSTMICPVAFTANIAITKNCPDTPVGVGETMAYSGLITNTGNITLVDVVVFNSVGGRDNPILGPISLAPNQAAPYFAAYVVTSGFCGMDTVYVEGQSLCASGTIAAEVTSVCPVDTNPRIETAVMCPAAPFVAGVAAVFTGVVSNSGDVDLRNVIVTNHVINVGGGGIEDPTVVFSLESLQPGESRTFEFSVTVPLGNDCCGIVDTLTAGGAGICGEEVSSSATAVCLLDTNPSIDVALECPTGDTDSDGWVEYIGTVRNAGDVHLTSVSVTHVGSTANESLVDSIALAPGETETFRVSIAADGSGALTPFLVQANGRDLCWETVVFADAICDAASPLQSANGSSDFNNDGLSDILFQHTDGSLAIWSMNGAERVASQVLESRLQDTDWRLVGAGDFDQDQRSDLLFQHEAGLLAVWNMDGATQIGSSFLSPNTVGDPAWSVVGVGDFNRDGRPDILFQHDQERLLALWTMNGVERTQAEYLTPNSLGDPQWTVRGVADFNGDGRPDLLLSHADGLLGVWFLLGSERIGATMLSPQTVNPDWTVAATGDYDGDGNTDILFQKPDGDLVMWRMLRTARLQELDVNPVNPGNGWRAVRQ